MGKYFAGARARNNLRAAVDHIKQTTFFCVIEFNQLKINCESMSTKNVTQAALKKLPSGLSYRDYRTHLKEHNLKDVAGMYAKYKELHGEQPTASATKRGRSTTTATGGKRKRSTSGGRGEATKAKRKRSTSADRGEKKEKREPSSWAMAITLAAADTGDKPPYAKGSATYNKAQLLKTASNLKSLYAAHQRSRPAKVKADMSEATKAALRAYSKAQSAYAKKHNMTVKAVKEARKEGTITRDAIMRFA